MLNTTPIISSSLKEYLFNHSYSSESSIEPAGSAGSSRLYYRIKDYDKSCILQVNEKNKKSSSEFDDFISLGKFFRSKSIPVPKIYAIDKENLQVLIEDLGKKTLLSYAEPSKPLSGNVRILYQDVIRKLVLMQEASVSVFLDRPSLASKKMDYNALKWESDYFIENYLMRYKGVQKIPTFLQEWFFTVANSVDSHPKVLMHRDFQSQNIMIQPNSEIVFIDYQGARRGSMYYDLASLLWDPYVSLPIPLIRDFFDYWVVEYLESHSFSKEESWRSFLEASLQRLMQALGAYCFLTNVKGKTQFETYIKVGEKRLLELLELLKIELSSIHKESHDYLKEQLSKTL
ncbi:MAG: phosphotransferase [Fibrobacter sp.]|nr:phosphotransferase [Fibrobacter sp.]